MSNLVHELQHPLVEHYLRVLRDQECSAASFRDAIRRLTLLLACEATRSLPTRPVAIETPMCAMTARELDVRVGLVPILRAGLAMVEPILDLLPDAEVWHLGFYRDEETLLPVPYYEKLPEGCAVDLALVLDPMLATGGSACASLEVLHQWGVGKSVYLGILGTPEGIQKLNEEFPDTDIYLCAIDEGLNDKGYILPGLGDAGDRAFNAPAQ